MMLIILGIVVFLLAGSWITKTYIAKVMAEKPTVNRLEWAIKLDPANARYHISLGRICEYVPETANPHKAMEQFRRAAELSPYDPSVWINLAAASEFRGDVAQAEKYLRRADYLAPHLPDFQWPIGNFYLLHGDNKEAFRHFKVVLAGSQQYNQLIFSIAWKASGNASEILRALIPHNLPVEFDYLSYLLEQHKYADTGSLWQRIINGAGSFPAVWTRRYIDALIAAHEPTEAYQVWTGLLRKGILRYAAPQPSDNLVTNGNFEDELSNLGFGWRIIPVEGVYAGVDTSEYHSANHSLRVDFNGKKNVAYANVFQYIMVKPSTLYRLHAWLKTSGITTDSGPRLGVMDAYRAGALDKLTPSMTGDSNGWVPVQLDFQTGPKSQLLLLHLVRLPSQKLDNLIAGKVWLDDVRLTPLKK